MTGTYAGQFVMEVGIEGPRTADKLLEPWTLGLSELQRGKMTDRIPQSCSIFSNQLWESSLSHLSEPHQQESELPHISKTDKCACVEVGRVLGAGVLRQPRPRGPTRVLGPT